MENKVKREKKVLVEALGNLDKPGHKVLEAPQVPRGPLVQMARKELVESRAQEGSLETEELLDLLDQKESKAVKDQPDLQDPLGLQDQGEKLEIWEILASLAPLVHKDQGGREAKLGLVVQLDQQDHLVLQELQEKQGCKAKEANLEVLETLVIRVIEVLLVPLAQQDSEEKEVRLV